MEFYSYIAGYFLNKKNKIAKFAKCGKNISIPFNISMYLKFINFDIYLKFLI